MCVYVCVLLCIVYCIYVYKEIIIFTFPLQPFSGGARLYPFFISFSRRRFFKSMFFAIISFTDKIGCWELQNIDVHASARVLIYMTLLTNIPTDISVLPPFWTSYFSGHFWRFFSNFSVKKLPIPVEILPFFKNVKRIYPFCRFNGIL